MHDPNLQGLGEATRGECGRGVGTTDRPARTRHSHLAIYAQIASQPHTPINFSYPSIGVAIKVSMTRFSTPLVRLRHDPNIGLGRLPAAGELLRGRFVGDRGNDDYILALLPVHRRRHLVLGCELH